MLENSGCRRALKCVTNTKQQRSENDKYYTSYKNNKSKFALKSMFKLLSSKEICNLKVFG
jgi:hypothetical protein